MESDTVRTLLLIVSGAETQVSFDEPSCSVQASGCWVHLFGPECRLA